MKGIILVLLLFALFFLASYCSDDDTVVMPVDIGGQIYLFPF